MECISPVLVILCVLSVFNTGIEAIQPALIVHGGAGTISRDRFQAKLDGMVAAIRAGYQILLDNDNPMDAVEAAVNVMERDPAFNAGRGSVQTETGEVEMDAAIMNGTSLEVGAVGAVRHILNPISLARLVMEKTKHVFIVGIYAEEFAVSQGIELVPTKDLIVNSTTNASTPAPKSKNIGPNYEIILPRSSVHDVGTVGAVAINSKGQIAAATSTGGMMGKMDGRVGDTPIIGGGTLADDDVGGFSATGSGEMFIRYRVASRIANLVEQGMEPSEAILKVLAAMTERMPDGDGGVISITKNGTIGFNWNSEQMAWAYMQHENIHSGIERDDDFTEPWNKTDLTSTNSPVSTTKSATCINIPYYLTVLVFSIFSMNFF